MALPPLLEALLAPFLDPGSRTFWGGLAASAVIALLVWGTRRPPGWSLAAAWQGLRSPSAQLDVQLLLARQLQGFLLGAPAVAGGWWLATHAVRLLDGALGVPTPPPLSPSAVALLYSVALFVVWDLSRFLAHMLMHRVPALWAFHQVHHSATVLTPLTFHRVHPVESAVYQFRGALATAAVAAPFFWLFRAQADAITLLGVPAIGLVLNVLTGNLRHSHVWLRFPPAVERWLLSPAQHQRHHSADPADFDANYGTWLAVWDRLAGTLRDSGAAPPAAFGVPDAERNHGDDLISAWIGPFRALLPRPRGLVLASSAVLLLLAGSAFAGEDDEGGEEDEAAVSEYGSSMIVYAPDGTPRVAGSAHVVDEAVLEQLELNDIGRILTVAVPGVNVRDEDGYGLRPNIGIRGANSDRSAKITLMEDGVLLAPAPYAAPAAYYFPMPTRLTGVEVFKGPAAIRYGPHTVGGAVNVLTRQIPRGTAYGLDLGGGSYLTAKGHGWVGTSNDRAGILIEGVHLHTGGFKELDTGGPTGFDRTDLMLKARYTPAAGHRLGLKLGYGRELSHETYLGLSTDDYAETPYRRYAATQNDLMRWNHTQAELSWTVQPSTALQVRTVAYHHWLGRAWTKFNGFASGIDVHDLLQQPDPTGQAAVYLAILQGQEDSTIDDQALLIGTNDRNFHSMGVQTEARWETYGDNSSSTLEAGIRLHADIVDRLHTEDPFFMQGGALVATGAATDTLLDSHTTAEALAAHLHEDLRLKDTHLIPGLRLEVVRTSRVDVGADPYETLIRPTLLPGLGLLQGVGPWLDAFAGSYRGFSPVAPGQPAEVRPEVSWNHEAGLRLHQGDLHAEVVGFLNDYQNITGQCTLSGGCEGAQIDQQYNGGEALIYGAEAAAGHVFLLPGELSLPLDLTYAWTRSRFQTGFSSGFPQFGTVEVGDSLPYVPEHQGSARLTLKHPRFSAMVATTARSGMLDEAGTFPVSDTDVPAQLLLDAALSANLTERVQLYATGNNLTNSAALASWRPFGARPIAPLQIMGGIKITPR